MAQGRPDTITIRDADIIWKNFAGEERQFNAEGARNFSIRLTAEQAEEMAANRWNVKPIKKRPGDEDEEQFYHLPVAVSYKIKPPRCYLLSNIDPDTNEARSKTMIGEGLVGLFDQLESTRVDVTLSAYDWEMRGQTGRKAYLQILFFTMWEDELEKEYSHIQTIPAAGDGAPAALEAGPGYDFEGEVVNGE